jgi:leucyl aminopeptidase
MVKELIETKEFDPKQSLTLVRFSGLRYATHCLLVGIGNDKKGINALGDLERLRRTGANIATKLKSEKIKSAYLYIESFTLKDADISASINEVAYALVEGFACSLYQFDKYLTNKKDDDTTFELHLVTSSSNLQKVKEGVQKAFFYYQGIETCRDLGNEPSNALTPVLYAKRVQELAKKYQLKCTVYDENWIQKQNMGLLWSVAKGSINPPRVVVLEYNPTKKAKKHISFVGKGVTFDTGGISLKPSARMEEMKFDMCGSAACVGAIITVSQLKLPIKVTAVIGLVENMPDGNATCPGHICKSRSGKNVEINNTDAEGRLVLADILDFTQTDLKPDYIVDLATLTGAVTIALGKACAGLFSNYESFSNLIKKAAKESGERVWELPLFDEYFDELKSAHADFRNSGDSPSHGSQKGAMFIKQFIKDETKWAHLDIASVANDLSLPYTKKSNATGYGVKLLTELAKNL